MTSRNIRALQNLMGDSLVTDLTVEDRGGTAFEQKMAEVFAPDVEVHEPECFAHGGWHHGREAWFTARREMLERRKQSPWDQSLEVLHMWDVPDDDVVIMNYMMTWTDTRTGTSFSQPAVEILTFLDGQIVRTEFFPHDSSALLETHR